MPTKAYDPTTRTFRVEFHLPAEAGAERAWLAGEFNGWSTDACPLTKRADGALAVTVALEPGRSYRFRYYLGDGDWENDWEADAYVDNVHGGADSVVHVPPAHGDDDGPPPVAAPGSSPAPKPTKKAAAKKAAAKKAAAKKAAAKKATPRKSTTAQREPRPGD